MDEFEAGGGGFFSQDTQLHTHLAKEEMTSAWHAPLYLLG
jgi:hypothetical protein